MGDKEERLEIQSCTEKQSRLFSKVTIRIRLRFKQHKDSTPVSPNTLPYTLTSYFVSTLTTAVAKGNLSSKDDEPFGFLCHFQ